MMKLARRALMFALVCCSALTSAAQDRPSFCEPITDALLGGLQAPYARQIAPDGTAYCEGLLRTPISLPPPGVVSVKQDQEGKFLFVPRKTASLTWCDDSTEPVHVQLRSLKSPMFALDAMNKVKFDWHGDLIATWQPDWANIAALGVRETTIAGKTYKVIVPLRYGAGYSTSYSFIVQSKAAIHFTAVLIEPLQPPDKTDKKPVTFKTGPTGDTWITMIPFARMKSGVYRVTFEEGIEQAGNTTEPIYLRHKVCGHP
jgi:hypothetical protein